MLTPWSISPAAVHHYARFCGVEHLPSQGPVWDRYERDLGRVARIAAERPPFRRSGGMWVYQVRADVKLYLFVTDVATPELVRVARRATFADTPPGAPPKRRGK